MRFAEAVETMTRLKAQKCFRVSCCPESELQWTGCPNRSVIFHQENRLAIPVALLVSGFAILWLLGMSGLSSLSLFVRAIRLDGLVNLGTPIFLTAQYQLWERFLIAAR